MFPDAGGVRDTFRAMAQELADLGYSVLLPNLYYRQGCSSRSTCEPSSPIRPNEPD